MREKPCCLWNAPFSEVWQIDSGTTGCTSNANAVHKPVSVDPLRQVAADNIGVHHGNSETSIQRDGGVSRSDGDGGSRTRFYIGSLNEMSTTKLCALTFFGQLLTRCDVPKAYVGKSLEAADTSRRHKDSPA